MTSAELENLVRLGQLEARAAGGLGDQRPVDEGLVDDLIEAAEAVGAALRAADLPPRV